MNFSLTEEQRLLKQMCATFATEEIAPWVRANHDVQWEGTADERFPRELWEMADELGLRLMHVPERLGGDGFSPDVLTSCIMLEELLTPDFSIGASFSSNWKLCKLLSEFPESVQDEWFPRIIDDPTFQLAHALTEPKGASDRWLPYNEPDGNMNTTAVREGDEWVLNGTKLFITNGYHAGLYFIYANTDPSAGMLDGTSGPFLVPRDADGFEVVRENQTMGHRFNQNGEVHLTDVRVPDEHLLIHNTALREVGSVFSGGRVKVAAKILGTARGAYEEAVEYANDRVQGGKPIVEHQMVRDRLAAMAVDLETARTIVWRAAEAADAGRPEENKLALIARYYAAEAAFDVARHAMEIHGGAGSVRAQGVERFLRDAAVNLHLHGTQDVHKLKIAKEVVGEFDPGTHA